MSKTRSILMIVLCAFLSIQLQAQEDTFFKSEEDKKEVKENALLDRLWFGTGLDGFGITSNSFNIGLSPIVGYKITKEWSAGLRLPIDYGYYKLQNSGTGENVIYNKVDIGIGAFTRVKIFRGLFAHTEYNQLWLNQPVEQGGGFLLDPENPNKLLTETIDRQEFNVGLGYSNGNRIGYEFSVLYNVIEPNESNILPFTIRAGLNYKF